MYYKGLDLMRVYMDISTIGATSDSNFGGGGIVRVIRSIANEFERNDKIDLRYCVTKKRHYFHKTLEIIQSIKCMDASRLGHRTLSHRIYLILDRMATRKNGALKRGITARITSPIRSAIDLIFTTDRRHNVKGIDVYHSTFDPVPQRIRAQGVPVVHTIYDLIPQTHPELCDPVFSAFFRKELLPSIRKDDFIHCISEFTRQELLRLRPDLDPNKLITIPLAADETFHPINDQNQLDQVRQHFSLPQRGRYLLMLNTLEARKNIDTAIRAFMLAKKMGLADDVHLILAGGKGWKTHRLEDELGRQSDLIKHIILTGFVPEHLLVPLYCCAEAFLFPSLCEGFGLPPLEAMQCGIPVIASKTTSVPEVVGNAGILVDPTSEQQMAEAIINIFSDNHFRENLANLSLEQAKKFHWSRTADKLIELYQTAIKAAALDSSAK